MKRDPSNYDLNMPHPAKALTTPVTSLAVLAWLSASIASSCVAVFTNWRPESGEVGRMEGRRGRERGREGGRS